MNKNSLLIVILILVGSTAAAYYFKTHASASVNESQQQQNWNDWDKKNANPPSNKNAEVSPSAPQTKPSAPPTTYQEALSASKLSDTPVLLIFSADWCHYCQDMKKTTFKDADVIKEMANFVVYEVNVDKEKAIAAKYAIRGMPTYKIVNANESVIAETSGFKKPKDFINWLRNSIPLLKK